MSDVLWKRIPQMGGLKGEGTLTIGFCVCIWDSQYKWIRRRAQLPGGDIGMQKIRQVGGGGSSEGGVTEGKSFVLHSVFDREPVK